MERALKEYEERRRKVEEERKKLKEEYTSRLLKRKHEILKHLEKLERKKIPENVDDIIEKIVERERRSYVDTLRRTLERIESIDKLGKFLPELSKLHVSHGKYLLLVFEKEIYAINRLLREISEDYTEYINRMAEIDIEPVELNSILTGIKTTREQLEEAERELEFLRAKLEEKEKELRTKEFEKMLEETESNVKILKSSIARDEIEIRSKISKLHKPIKRLRTGEKIADEILKDSSYGIEHPEEFLSFLIKIRGRLEGKYRQTADWIVENLEPKSGEIMEKRKRLKELMHRRHEILQEKREIENEIERIKTLILEKEARIKRLRERLLELERELHESLSKLERILNTRINL